MYVLSGSRTSGLRAVCEQVLVGFKSAMVMLRSQPIPMLAYCSKLEASVL